MKVVSTEALTKLIQLVKSAFISVDDTVETSEVELLDIVASKDLSNITPTQTVKNEIIGWGMPDYTAGIAISTGSYTPPSDGLIRVEGGNNSTNKYIDVNGARAANAYVNSTTSTDIIAFVQKGDTIAIVGTGVDVYFYPLKGAN